MVLAVGGVQYGPVTEDALRLLVAEGRVARTDVVWRDGMTEWQPAESAMSFVQEAPFFAVGIPKFVLMTVVTFGFYEVYWFYMHWRIIRDRTKDDIWPVPRAVFAIFFMHQLMEEVEKDAAERHFELTFPKVALAVLFFLLNIAWRLPEPLFLLGFATLIPLVIIQRRVNALHAAVVPFADPNRRIRRWNWLIVVVGGLFLLLALIGFTLPDQP